MPVDSPGSRSNHKTAVRDRDLVFVSGCFDMLHSGHIAFLQRAASLGDLIVSVGSDRTIISYKGRRPVIPENERIYMIKALACVSDAFIAKGSGHLDFEAEFRERMPNIFVVNADGDSPAKRTLCESLGVSYVVFKREPSPGLTARSTTGLRRGVRAPYRIDLAGGWLDQPFVSRHHPGPVVVASIEPDQEYDKRSGMATSTREVAEKLWGGRTPHEDPEEAARMLFGAENPPGKQPISGSQDAIGIVLPGVNRLAYKGEHWPSSINSHLAPEGIAWLENSLNLIQLGSRPAGFDVLEGRRLSCESVRRLAVAAESCWTAILNRDLGGLGKSVLDSFEAQLAIFPRMAHPGVEAILRRIPSRPLGWKMMGAGGGGYLLLISSESIPGSLRPKIRRIDA